MDDRHFLLRVHVDCTPELLCYPVRLKSLIDYVHINALFGQLAKWLIIVHVFILQWFVAHRHNGDRKVRWISELSLMVSDEVANRKQVRAQQANDPFVWPKVGMPIDRIDLVRHSLLPVIGLLESNLKMLSSLYSWLVAELMQFFTLHWPNLKPFYVGVLRFLFEHDIVVVCFLSYVY